MPTYTFRDLNTNEISEHVMRISEYDEFVKNNPQLERYHGTDSAPGLSDPVRLGIRQPASGFKDLLKQIRKNNIWSKINTY